MKIYLVGGAVRDKLLGLPVKERDWVVVGATVEDMLKLGYRQVGKEFPVFLHPKTKEEYALARVERKVQPGYRGFAVDTSPDVSLEEDLIRRDLTINAMAEDEQGKLIDPYHGQEDLNQKLLRHVSPAFSEDPVRILRVGRFLARYARLGFSVAPESIALMGKMVKAGEVNALVAERVFKELDRALAEPHPEKFFELLDACGALAILFPSLKTESDGMHALKTAAKLTPKPVIRFAALLHALPDAKKTIPELCERYRTPNAYKALALLTAAHYNEALNATTMSSKKLLSLLNALDSHRREARFHDFLIACDAIAQTCNNIFDPMWLKRCADAAASVDVKAILATGVTGPEFIALLNQKRLTAIEEWRNDLL